MSHFKPLAGLKKANEERTKAKGRGFAEVRRGEGNLQNCKSIWAYDHSVLRLPSDIWKNAPIGQLVRALLPRTTLRSSKGREGGQVLKRRGSRLLTRPRRGVATAAAPIKHPRRITGRQNPRDRNALRRRKVVPVYFFKAYKN